MAERGIGHGGVEHGIVDAVEFEGEEQQMQRGGGDALLHVAVEFGAHRIGGVAGIDQRGIGDEPAELVLDRLVALDRLGQRLARIGARGHRRQAALEGLLEGRTFVVGPVEVQLELRRIETGIKVLEVPFRQIAELGAGFGARFGRFHGLFLGRGFGHGGDYSFCGEISGSTNIYAAGRGNAMAAGHFSTHRQAEFWPYSRLILAMRRVTSAGVSRSALVLSASTARAAGRSRQRSSQALRFGTADRSMSTARLMTAATLRSVSYTHLT